MDATTIVLVLTLIALGGAFAYWGIKKTLSDDTGKSRRARRGK